VPKRKVGGEKEVEVAEKKEKWRREKKVGRASLTRMGCSAGGRGEVLSKKRKDLKDGGEKGQGMVCHRTNSHSASKQVEPSTN